LQEDLRSGEQTLHMSAPTSTRSSCRSARGRPTEAPETFFALTFPTRADGPDRPGGGCRAARRRPSAAGGEQILAGRAQGARSGDGGPHAGIRPRTSCAV